MHTITHAEVQTLVAKLPLVYRLLHALTTVEGESPKAKFICLSADERRQLLSQQAEQMKNHYKHTTDERTKWQAEDFSRSTT